MKSGTAINQTTLHSSTMSRQSEKQWKLARSGAVRCWASVHASEALVPNKGGRGIQPLRLFGLRDPAAARFQGTSCYTNLCPLQGISRVRLAVSFRILRPPCSLQ
jgi:hypothetical protein